MSWRKSQSAIALTIQIYMIWQTLIKRTVLDSAVNIIYCMVFRRLTNNFTANVVIVLANSHVCVVIRLTVVIYYNQMLYNFCVLCQIEVKTNCEVIQSPISGVAEWLLRSCRDAETRREQTQPNQNFAAEILFPINISLI